MNLVILIFVTVNLFVAVIFGSLYWGSKSIGLVVPDHYIPTEKILNFPIETVFNCINKEITPLKDTGGIPLTGDYEAKMMKCATDAQPVVITAVYWKNHENAQKFWTRYYRQICRNHIRRKAFRNNLWAPKFVTGRYGANAPFDITAWYQDDWFFFIGVSTQIKGYNQLKGSIRTLFTNHIKTLS